MNTNTKMMIHLLVTTIGPLVVWGLLYLAEIQAEGQHLELAPTLRGGFLRVGIAYITGIVYLVLLVIWFLKYRSVSWGLRLLPLLPLLIFLGVWAYNRLSFAYQKQNYSANAFIQEHTLDNPKQVYVTTTDGQSAVQVDDHVAYMCICYSLAQEKYDIPSEQMEDIIADSLPTLMNELEEATLCEGAYDAKTGQTTYSTITMDSWSYDPTTHQLSVTYSSRPEPKLYEIDIR